MSKQKILLIVPPFVALIILVFSQLNVSNSKQIRPNMAQETVPASAEINNTASPDLSTAGVEQKPEVSESDKDALASESEAPSYIDQIRAIQEKTALHSAVLKDHESFTRYPSNNLRFERLARDPIAMRYEVDERTTLSDDKRSSLTVWSDKKYYLASDTATISARLTDENGKALQPKFLGQLIYSERENLNTLIFDDTDQDGTYTTQVSFASDSGSLRPGIYKVIIANDLGELSDAVSFTLSSPSAEVSGNFRDTLTPAGNLLIEVELEVNTANRIYLQGSLYSSTDDAIGSSQTSVSLQPGTHWVALEFYGLMIRDAQEPGPFLLKHLELAKVGIPIERSPMLEPNYYTEGYTLDQFTGQRFEEKQSLK
jgi:hypothetical protein